MVVFEYQDEARTQFSAGQKNGTKWHQMVLFRTKRYQTAPNDTKRHLFLWGLVRVMVGFCFTGTVLLSRSVRTIFGRGRFL